MFIRTVMFAATVVYAAVAHAQSDQYNMPGQEGPPAQHESMPHQVPPPAQQSGGPAAKADADRPNSDRCGAVAYTADGAFGAAYGMENCSDAERLAIGECQRESTDKSDCLRGVLVRKDTWFHIQFCRDGGEFTTHVTTKQTLAEANVSAADWARQSKYGAGNCRLVPNGLIHSGGLHAKM